MLSVQDLRVHFEVRGRGLPWAVSDSVKAVNGVSFELFPGETLGIVGESGCGKSTAGQMIVQLLEPTEGEILIGGIKLSNLGLTTYRQMLGTVMQDDTLFAGSISDNISFFDPSPDQQRVQTCSAMAAVHAEIAQMPMAFNTLVGDIGTGLSGGQKQRILLARALYRNPKILVLDEATSHLDVWNEQAVNTAIKKIQLTRVIVAHRPETIAMAERVVILQKGSIARDVMQSLPHEESNAA